MSDRKRTATVGESDKHRKHHWTKLAVEAPVSPSESEKELAKRQQGHQSGGDSGSESDPFEQPVSADDFDSGTTVFTSVEAASEAAGGHDSAKDVSQVDRHEFSVEDELNASQSTVLFMSQRFHVAPIVATAIPEKLSLGLLAATRGDLDDVYIDPSLKDIAVAAAAASGSAAPTAQTGSSAPSVQKAPSKSVQSSPATPAASSGAANAAVLTLDAPRPACADGPPVRPFVKRVVAQHQTDTRFQTLSTRSRAAEFKKVVSKYYDDLERHFAENIFMFDVLIGRDRRRRKLCVDLSRGGLTRFKKDGKRKKTYIGFRELLQVVKSTRDPLMVALKMRNGKVGMVRFPSMVDRERFYAVCWLGQCNFFASKTIAPREEPVSIYVGTFNMAGEHQDEPADLWLGGLKNDIIAICAQECSESQFRDLVAPLKKSHVLLDFVSILYVKLVVFIRRRHIPKIRSVQHSHVTTGIGGFVGNKGAVAISFTFDDTSLCFIGAHLAPHDKNLDLRNKQYSSIIRQMKIGMPLCDTLNQFDHVIWCGDLNYRVPVTPDVSIPLIQEGNFQPLLEVDQLTQMRKKRIAFVDFAEGRIAFPPTFKLVKARPVNVKKVAAVASEEVDKEKEKKKSKKKKKLGKVEGGYATKRGPSWCDRVVWKSSPAASPLKLVEYQSSNLFVASDHNPVHAVFRTRFLLPVEPSMTVPLVLSFKDQLSATDLRWPGSPAGEGEPPNIVLIFKAPFLDPTQTYYSNIKNSTFNPVWEEGEVNDMPTCICDPRYLAHKSLTVLLYHFDSAFQGIIGRCVIPLGNSSMQIADSSIEGVRFTTRVTLHGNNVGALSGTICVFPANT